jgi:type IV pilus assembly protein PilB
VTIYHGAGCEICGKTGYKGRVGLFEVMKVTQAMREAILSGATSDELRRTAINEGMITLRQSGLQKIKAGTTSVEEVLRETVK